MGPRTSCVYRWCGCLFIGHGEWGQGLLVFIDGVGVYRPW